MGFAGSSVLIVDDEEGIRELLKDKLQEQGYCCHTAANGEAALDFLANEEVDLVLLDIMMPGMTGLNLFERTKEMYPDMAVIFITAMEELNVAVENLRNGASDYIVKPVPRKRLTQAVE